MKTINNNKNLNKEQLEKLSIAVAIPCYNEAVTIKKVINDFREVLPKASIYVFDNNSTDNSDEVARSANAITHYVHRQGKGNVMNAIFEEIEADIIIVVDGDDTYFAEDVYRLLEPVIKEEADMVVGNRLTDADDVSLKKLHQIGNRLIVSLINRMFGTSYQDILSGYRIFSRRFVKYVPLLKSGFETETELTLQSLENGFEVVEIPISYRKRPLGSFSKLRTFRDGYRIMLTAAVILRDHEPMRFFGFFSLISLFFILAAGGLRMLDYLGYYVMPKALLTGLIMIFAPVGTITFGIGLILSAINSRFREMKQIMRRKNNKL